MNNRNHQDAGHYLSRAVTMAVENVDRNGGPFGAVVVTADGRAFDGLNRVTENNDPTAHAEVTAIRAACSGLETFSLEGAALYTSCEPCPMCLASALWARIDRVVFAADRYDAADAGFDDAAFYDYFDTPVEQRSMPVRQMEPDGVVAVAPFDAWKAHSTRVAY